jgi:hypothetical protein
MRRVRTKGPELGIALLISIFILLLISVVAIALIVSSGTESALAGNYRSSTGVYYAAMAGLEEARSRLVSKNPSYFRTTSPTFLPSPGTPLAPGSPVYMINPLPSETVAPWDLASTYPDNQFNQEFLSSGYSVPPSPPWTNSVWNTPPLNGLSFPGPLYKWVRINAISETSLGVQVAPYDGHIADPTKPIFYDSTSPPHAQLNVSNSGAQVLEITALAALPNGSQKLLQYLVALVPAKFPDFPTGQLSFPATLTLSGSTGNGASFHAPSSNSSYVVKGDDYDCSPVPVLTGAKYPAIGVFTNADALLTGPVIGGAPPGIPPAYRPNYTGLNNPGPYIPDVENVSSLFPATLQMPSKLDLLAQSIAQYADVTIPSGPITYPLPTVTGAALTPLGMSPSKPLTVVVNGNLDISNWSNDGYGLLLVIGNFTYDPDTNWYGIILVIGQGKVLNSQNGQYKQINGAMLVAKTRNLAGSLLPDPNLGGASVSFLDAMQGNGIRYSNCWIQKAQPTASYKILSFHEISQ